MGRNRRVLLNTGWGLWLVICIAAGGRAVFASCSADWDCPVGADVTCSCSGGGQCSSFGGSEGSCQNGGCMQFCNGDIEPTYKCCLTTTD